MKEKFLRGYSSTWMNKPTFKLYPITDQCPYLEAIFLPEEKLLVIVSKQKHTKLEYLQKLDDDGNPILAKHQPKDRSLGPYYKRKQVTIDDNYSYTLNDINDIKNFLADFADDKFDFEKYLK